MTTDAGIPIRPTEGTSGPHSSPRPPGAIGHVGILVATAARVSRLVVARVEQAASDVFDLAGEGIGAQPSR